jgi:hypothetical protein
MKTIAIDFGTYNTVCVYKDEEAIRIVKHEPSYEPFDEPCSLESEKEMPSFLYIDDGGIVREVGRKAKELAAKYPNNVIWGVKRLLGRTYMSLLDEISLYPFEIEADPENGNCMICVNQHFFKPSEILVAFFQKILGDLNENQIFDYDELTLTVPVFYSSSAVNEIIHAACLAGFDKEKIKTISEPVAAALGKGINPRVGEQIKTLVFDIGAGTTDMSVGYLITENQQTRFDCLKTLGANIGGIDITNLLEKIIVEKLNSQDVENKAFAFEIKRLAEYYKIRLTYSPEVLIPFDNQHLVITREDLETKLNPVLDQLQDMLKWVCEAAGWKTTDVQQLLIVGGPTIMPVFKKLLLDVFQENVTVSKQINLHYVTASELKSSINAVGLGAVRSVDCCDLQALGFGVELTRFPSHNVLERYPEVLIPPGSPYPYQSKVIRIPVISRTGISDIKILQFKEEAKTETVSFIGGIRFLSKSFLFSEIQVQMVVNERKQLIVLVADPYGGRRVFEYECLSTNIEVRIEYPASYLLPELPKEHFNLAVGPENEDMNELIKVGCHLYEIITNQQVEIPERILKYLEMLVNENHEFQELFNIIVTVLWNSKVHSLISDSEISEMEMKISELQNKLIKLKNI